MAAWQLFPRWLHVPGLARAWLVGIPAQVGGRPPARSSRVLGEAQSQSPHIPWPQEAGSASSWLGATRAARGVPAEPRAEPVPEPGLAPPCGCPRHDLVSTFTFLTSGRVSTVRWPSGVRRFDFRMLYSYTIPVVGKKCQHNCERWTPRSGSPLARALLCLASGSHVQDP